MNYKIQIDMSININISGLLYSFNLRILSILNKQFNKEVENV